MKRLLILAFLFFSSLALAGDSDDFMSIEQYFAENPEQNILSSAFASIVSAQANPIKTRQTKTVSVAVVYPAIQQSSYWKNSVKSMEARFDELGIRHETMKYYSKPSGDYRLQTMQIAEAVKGNVDYLVLSVDNNNVKRLVPSLVAKGKPKIIVQNLTTPITTWKDRQPLMYVGFDHTRGAKIIADHYAYHFPKGAKYLMLYGAKGTVSEQRGGGFETYGMSKGFVPVAKFYTDFSAEKAYDAVKTTLTKNPDISFIYSCSTDIAIGASKALAETGKSGKILVNGWGGTMNEIALIKKGQLDFTVVRINDDNGVAIADAVKMDLLAKTNDIPRIFSGEFMTVTKNMSEKDINKIVERAFRYSGK